MTATIARCPDELAARSLLYKLQKAGIELVGLHDGEEFHDISRLGLNSYKARNFLISLINEVEISYLRVSYKGQIATLTLLPSGAPSELLAEWTYPHGELADLLDVVAEDFYSQWDK
jgi:hypothetical protein